MLFLLSGRKSIDQTYHLSRQPECREVNLTGKAVVIPGKIMGKSSCAVCRFTKMEIKPSFFLVIVSVALSAVGNGGAEILEDLNILAYASF
jgi:hypothetical protein